ECPIVLALLGFSSAFGFGFGFSRSNFAQKETPHPVGWRVSGKAPGDDLLSHGLSHTTIGAAAFHFRVRDGIGWFHSANFTRETVGAALDSARLA
ncbi:hypothetical protein XPR_2049, partial [Xanthomonas arboricola pv. pruni MAFF 301420]